MQDWQLEEKNRISESLVSHLDAYYRTQATGIYLHALNSEIFDPRGFFLVM